MINSVNSLEFLKPKLLPMEKYNSTTTTKLLPPSSFTQTRTFVAISGHHHNNAVDSIQEKQPQYFLNDEVKHQERVRVQHLQNHTKLQNNKCWNNFRTLYNISASPDISGREMFQIRQIKDDNEIDVVHVEHLSSASVTPINIRNKSAFNLDLNNEYHNNDGIDGNINCNDLKIDSLKAVENNNNNKKFYCKQDDQQLPTTSTITMSTSTISQRTVDQNNAYRHIESVHNYAKSKSFEGDDDEYTSPNGSRHSSYDEDDDEDEDNDGGAEYDNDDDVDYEDNSQINVDKKADNLEADYADIFNKRRYRGFQKLSISSDGALLTKNGKIVNSKETVTELKKSDNLVDVLKDYKNHRYSLVSKNDVKGGKDDEEIHVDIDVETIESQSLPTVSGLGTIMTNNGIGEESTTCVKPDHHARRPMNAFLIFCKRHRAIVKERYKNLENRAITKILGDWWASLDIIDKKCFTSLAQQNKDAFFSANPNFKWYKLPAPPLRTLTTRPASSFDQDYQEDNDANAIEIRSNNTRYNNIHSNYFKLADEAQMGDLSQLMQDKSKTSTQCVDLQQVLGETSQFMRAHITGNSEILEENHLKRRFYNENSFSSNSSEEDAVESKKKSARTCKGKRYQELINSGQIATALKKSKSSIRPICIGGTGSGNDDSEINIKRNFSAVSSFNNNFLNSGCQKSSVSESENIISHDLNSFDLEERIKLLPALNLDDYLQRKRNTKKKKKFVSNGKKRNQRSNNSNNITTGSIDNDNHVKILSKARSQQEYKKLIKREEYAATAVGSQKRKARKESITRRDVSAIEQEVASLLPLTINGCCYFQEAPTTAKYIKIEKDTETPQSLNGTSTLASPTIPLRQNDTNTSNIVSNDNISSSTSDLLILAEVAANRTELKH